MQLDLSKKYETNAIEDNGRHDWNISVKPLALEYRLDIFDEFTNSIKVSNIVEIIEEAGNNDLIRFNISSPGGALWTLQALLHALSKTEAHTVAQVNSAYSCAALLALNCDSIHVSEASVLMLHAVSAGTFGKSVNMLKRSESVDESTRFFTKICSGFITRDEARKMKDGVDLYFHGADIARRFYRMKRFRRRFGYFGEEDIVTIRRREAAEQLKNTKKKKNIRKTAKKKKVTKKSK